MSRRILLAIGEVPVPALTCQATPDRENKRALQEIQRRAEVDAGLDALAQSLARASSRPEFRKRLHSEIAESRRV